jgi:dTDP-4-amino-4,6-dideoxygalactose transaminase
MTDPHANYTHDVVEETWSPDDLSELRYAPDPIAKFCTKFAEIGGIGGKVSLMTSGRQALQFLLSGLPRDSGRTDVLLSAFNCPVVAHAVRGAGYRPVFYDFSSTQGNVNWHDVAKGINARVAAIIISHFFGAPADAEVLRVPARQEGAYIIEDCAHTFGASVHGLPVGSLWDAAVFSFNYGKPISLCGGAALVLNSDALQQILPPATHIDEASENKEIQMYMEVLATSRQAIRPVSPPIELIRRVMRRLKLMKPLTPGLAKGFGQVRAALGLICLARWAHTQSIRNANANFVAARGIPLWHLPEGVTPSWLRLRVTLRDKKALAAASSCIRNRGFRAGNFNWPSIDTKAGYVPYATQAAKYGIDVPIHQNMTIEDLSFVAEVLSPLVLDN